jgi:hypothetical protein
VHVDDAIDAVVGFLHLHEVDDRAEVIAEMQITGRLDARKNPFNKSHFSASPRILSRMPVSRRRLPRRGYQRKPSGMIRRSGYRFSEKIMPKSKR